MDDVRPSKRTKLFKDDDSSNSDASSLSDRSLQVNNDYAKRFEHNKRRDELMKRKR